jgi:hypothetical protein
MRIPWRETLGFLVGAALSRHREVECARCKARLKFRKSPAPHFDSSGFESYDLECRQCRARLFAIIDPLDGAVLLSEKSPWDAICASPP